MITYDPPADPFGDERQCRICDTPLEYDPLCREWYCPADHDEEGRTEVTQEGEEE